MAIFLGAPGTPQAGGNPAASQRYDTIIVGCGPAGLSAAINLAIRQKSFLVLGTDLCSPKMQKSPQIDNYLGVPAISGEELRQRFLHHAAAMGVEIRKARVDTIYPDGEGFSLSAKGEIYQARSLIIATGVASTRLLPGEQDLLGRGVSYCATCDGPLYRGRTVAVLAYAPEAEEEANYLAGVAGRVLYIPLYRPVGPLDSRVQVLPQQRPERIEGAGRVERLVLSGQTLAADAVFIFREMTPAQQLMAELEMENGNIKVDRHQATNVPGIFAAGDCTGRPYQLAKAVGEGQVAALEAASYLERLRTRERSGARELMETTSTALADS
ncbi:MAG: NAD(P)/FAD-dependent oxidoreductase [Firmicutes bacterium]|nr:NAD(P)/FAD-dependent oxidoreductase [Bacillota bacterium]